MIVIKGSEQPNPQKRPMQFRLGCLFGMTLMIAIPCGLVTYVVSEYRKSQAEWEAKIQAAIGPVEDQADWPDALRFFSSELREEQLAEIKVYCIWPEAFWSAREHMWQVPATEETLQVARKLAPKQVATDGP